MLFTLGLKLLDRQALALLSFELGEPPPCLRQRLPVAYLEDGQPQRHERDPAAEQRERRGVKRWRAVENKARIQQGGVRQTRPRKGAN